MMAQNATRECESNRSYHEFLRAARIGDRKYDGPLDNL